jgi:hypothetical protein
VGARSIGAAFGLSALARTAIASLVASAAVFQPLMLEFIGWPISLPATDLDGAFDFGALWRRQSCDLN